jgi:hypothetical protein
MPSNSFQWNSRNLNPEQHRVLTTFAKNVQRGQHRAARAVFEKNTWLANVPSPPGVLYEWFDLPLGNTGAPTIKAGLDTLDFLLEKNFTVVFDAHRKSYDRVLGWFEQHPGSPYVCWFRDHGLISNEQASQHRLLAQDKTNAIENHRASAVEVLDKCRSPEQRLDMIKVNVEPWVADHNHKWVDILRTKEEVVVAIKTLRALNKTIRANGGTAASTTSVAAITKKLFENPEWATEPLVLNMARCGKDGSGIYGALDVLGDPWQSEKAAAKSFSKSVNTLSDEVAPMWLNIAIGGLIKASCVEGSSTIGEVKAICNSVIEPLLDRCGPDAVNEKIVGAGWRNYLSPAAQSVIDRYQLSQSMLPVEKMSRGLRL